MGRLSALRKKEVINLEDGRKIGVVYDVDIDWQEGRVKAIMVRTCADCYMGMKRKAELIIPYDRVVRAGGDCILVRAEPKYIMRFLEAGS